MEGSRRPSSPSPARRYEGREYKDLWRENWEGTDRDEKQGDRIGRGERAERNSYEKWRFEGERERERERENTHK